MTFKQINFLKLYITMARKSIPINTQRELWAQCGGYCQNPDCHKYLFAKIEADSVSLANIAHIIGAGKTGPRTEHEIAEFIDKNGISNLIMLCLDCHKIVDELENKFSVEEMHTWKSNHLKQIQAIFTTPKFYKEQELLQEINDLLDENRLVFEEYGPFSEKAMYGSSGDSQIIWHRRCLDTIIPNNRRIIEIIEGNKRNFPRPWDLYSHALSYKIHANSFEENCLFAEKINDYKLFPIEFDQFVKQKLGLQIDKLEKRTEEEIEYRTNTISTYINKYLANHTSIKGLKKQNIAIFTASLVDGRELKVFVTNTYYFTDYTLEKILEIDPNIDAIICSNPYSTYSASAKKECIRQKIGLFSLREFMGAIHTTGERFLNYLLNVDKNRRVKDFSDSLKNNSELLGKCEIYLLGSYLRHNIFDDIDIILVYREGLPLREIDNLRESIKKCFERDFSRAFDFTVCSESEFLVMSLDYDNKVQVF